MDIQEQFTTPEGNVEHFTFFVGSRNRAVEFRLNSYRLTSGKTTLKRWEHFGNDGTFVKRDSIVVPEEVIQAVKTKIIDSITFVL